MRTPEEIKQGLKVCSEISPSATACKACPYDEECRKAYEEEDIVPGSAMMLDALAYIRQLERERDDALTLIGKLTVLLKKYPYAATNGCAYEAHREIKKYLQTVANKQEDAREE